MSNQIPNMNAFSKMIQNYNKNLWKHNKKWANDYYGDEDVVHSKYSDMFVHERSMNAVKDFYLKSPVKELFGQEFCNLLWKLVDLYEEIKDEYYNNHSKPFNFNMYPFMLSGDNEYRILYEAVLEKIYVSSEFKAILDFMKNNNIPYQYNPLNNWEDYYSFSNPSNNYYKYSHSKIVLYSSAYCIDLICLNYAKNKLLVANKEKVNNSKRELFNSIMKKYSLPAEDKDYEKYLAWDANKACHLGSINRYKKMSIYAIWMS